MLQRSAVGVAVLVVVVAGLWVQQALSQDTTTNPAADKMKARMDQMRQQMTDRAKDVMGATDDEWKVLLPLLEKVQNLSQQTRGGGANIMNLLRGGRGGGPGGGGPGGGPAATTATPQTEVDKASTALQKVLDNKEAKPEEIKAALATLREARTKARLELEAAQKELREVLTVRQEALLVSVGLLE
jgi:hypothetical protein